MLKISIRFLPVFILLVVVCVTWGQDEWEDRHNKLQPPEQVMDSLGVKPGMVVGEVGAGRGRYVVHLARRVGQTGKVYANDIDEKSLTYLKQRCKRDKINNVETILGDVIDPKFPEGKLALVYVINTYHHLDKPVALMKNIVPGLKPGGHLAIIEHDPEKMDEHSSHSTPKNTLIEQANDAGFELVKTFDFLVRDIIYVFKVKN